MNGEPCWIVQAGGSEVTKALKSAGFSNLRRAGFLVNRELRTILGHPVLSKGDCGRGTWPIVPL